MTNEEMLSVAEIVERLVARFHKQADDHEAKMVEHRAAFGVRTEADAKIIAGLREERDRWKSAFYDQSALLGVINAALGIHAGDDVCGEIDRLHKERDGLLTQVQDMRAALAKEQELHAATALRLSTEAAKMAERKHPVKVGEWVRRTTGSDSGRMAQVKSIAVLQYDVQIDGYKAFWASSNCDPCDPPATHDTEAGKAVAESAAKTEPVADEIKVGDLVEVYQATAVCTRQDDIGSRGIVEFADECVSLTPVDGFKAAQENHVGLCDVRKVTT